MSRQSSHQATGGRPAGHQQHRTSTPSRILDELLALGPEVAPANVTVLDYRHSKWRQEGALDESFSSQFAQALGESLGASSSCQSPASSDASNTTLTPPATSGAGQQEFSFDSFQPTSAAAALSGVKILDIRRTKTDRRRATKPAGGNEALASDQMQRANKGNTQATSSEHRSNQQHQRQQSGETLSSYESDYDLLVYLGETETEDIVETERSLDYQDQTWRQSICGGASLAPTIDESLSELLSTGNVSSTQLLAGPSVTPSRLNVASLQEQPSVGDLNSNADHFDSSQARSGTSNSTYAAKARDIYATNNNQSGNWSSTLPHPTQQRQSPRICAEKQNLANTLNIQPSIGEQTRFSASNQVPYTCNSVNSVQEQPDGAANKKLGFGNQLVSLFNRKQPARQQTIETTEPIEQVKRPTDGQQWVSLSKLPTVEPPKQFASRLAARNRHETMDPSRRYQHLGEHLADGSDDAAELDRLLAEMSQSLDLDSLARYDPHKGLPQRMQQSRGSKTITDCTQPLTHNVTRVTSKPSPVSTARSRDAPPEQSPYANLQTNSLLDEYDGASKMLEQMITDQLEESSRSNRSATKGTETMPSSKKSTGSQAKSASRKFSSSSAATTEVSVISNPLVKRGENCGAIERYANLTIHQRAPVERVIKVGPERDTSQIGRRHSVESLNSLELCDSRPPPELLENIPTSDSRHVVSQRLRMQSAGKLGPQETMVKAQQPTDDHHPREPRSSTSRSPVSSASSQPPKPPAPDYHDEGPTSLESHVIQAEAAAISSSSSSASDNETSRTNRPRHKQMMNKMKLRTLSGMRNMRNKFNDLTSPKRDSLKMTREDQPQQAFNLPRHEVSPQAPRPPKRSSSIGSNKSGTQSGSHIARVSDKEQLEARLKSPEPAESSPRQSRGRERKRELRQQGDAATLRGEPDLKDNKSFGRQLRERLSRSKSRFRQFLSGPQLFRKRAQSTPDEKRHLSAAQISAPIGSGADLVLYQPGDIARNTPIQEQQVAPGSALSSPGRDRFDSSLERHLMASLAPKTVADAKNETQLKGPTESEAVSRRRKSSSSSTSDLSGLDTTGKKRVSRFELPPIARSARAARRRRQLKGGDKEEVESVYAGKAQQRRPTSLISLKRLGGSFSRSRAKEQSPAGDKIEDLDSTKVRAQHSGSSHNLTRGASKSSKRRAKRRNKSNLSDRNASPDSLTREQLAPKRATTDDYFGLVAPPKAAESPEPVKPPASVHLRIEMGPRVRPASALKGDEKASLNSQNQRKSTNPSKAPHRSHSLRSIGKRCATVVQDDEVEREETGAVRASDPLNQKAVSFHNLASTPTNQRRQLCPASPNSFRPTSVTPTPPPKPMGPKVSLEEAPISASSGATVLTPVQPTQTPLKKATETREVELKPNSLEAPEVRPGGKSPIRDRGAAFLGDIRTKYNELFRPNNKRGAEASSARSISPPARPPRRRKRDPKSAEASRRARSLAADELPREFEHLDQSEPRFIEVEPSSPPTSLLQIDSMLESPSEKSKAIKQPASERLAELASHFKSSAANFFHPQKSSAGLKTAPESARTANPKTAARPRPFLRNIDEPMRQVDLCNWRPIIESTRKSSAPDGAKQSSRSTKRSNSFRIQKDATARSDSPMQLKSRASVDSDSTWESSESSHKADLRTSDRAGDVQADLTNRDDSSSKSASRTQQVAQTSGLERDAAATKSPRPVAGPPAAAGDELRASARHGSISHASSGPQLREAERAELNEEPAEVESARLGGHSAIGGTAKTFTQVRAEEAKRTERRSLLESDDVGGNLIGDRNNNTQQHRHTTPEHLNQRQADAATKRIATPRGKIVAHGELKSDARPIGETKAPLEEDERASMKSDASPRASELQQAVARFEPKEFKFNDNLPSPSELSQEQANKMAIEGTARTAASQRRLDDADLKFIKATSHRRPQMQATSRPSPNLKAQQQEQDNGSQQNRLSVYENVNASDQPADSSLAIQARHLMGSSLLGDNPRCDRYQQESDSNRDDEWKVELDDRLVQRLAGLESINPRAGAAQKSARAESQAEEITSTKTSATMSKKPERKLVSMTSIIHEPEDELMNVSTTSANVRAPERGQKHSNQMKTHDENEITMGDLDDLLDNQENGHDAANQDDDDDDDSFAAAAASRKLLVNRFEQRMEPPSGTSKRTLIEKPPGRSTSVKQKAAAFLQPSGASNQASLRAAPRPTGSSLVQRLAKNFDQTVREQPAARGLVQTPSSRHQTPLLPSASPSSPSHQTGGKVRHPLGPLASFEQDEPKSDSTWYDAKSIELLDEAEVAQLLREFDDQGTNASAADRQSEATNEPYLSVADQKADELTLSHDDTGQRDNHAHQDDDDDPTLNDDETLNEDDQTEPNVDLLDQEEEESVYASVATSSSQQAEPKGKDRISQTNLASPAATPNSTTTPLVERSPAVAGARDVLKAAKWLDFQSRTNATAADATQIANQSWQDKDLLSWAPDKREQIETGEEEPEQQTKQQHEQQASKAESRCHSPPPPPPPPDLDFSRRFAKSDTIETFVPHSPGQAKTNPAATSPTSTIIPPKTQTHDSDTQTVEQIDNKQAKRTSSMFSASLSSTDSLNNDDLRALESLNSKSLVRAAKKCSRLYEELEKLLLARQRAVEQRPASEESESKSAPLDTTLTARDQEPHDYDLEESEQRDSTSSRVQQPGGRLEPDEDDDEDGDDLAASDLTSDRSSSRGDDQISLSSSSLNSETLPQIRQRQNLQKLYNIVNEICSSEEKFLATLRLLNVDFRQHIHDSLKETGTHNGNNTASSKHQPLQQPPFDVVGAILKHLPQLQTLNENLLTELKRARDQWPKTQKISHVLVKIGPFLKHYSGYIRDFEIVQAQYNENLRKFAQFSDVITSFERTHEDKCQKLSVQHHLLRPIQRIPQYRLLLQQYLHHLKPDDADYEDTVNALEVVSRVAEHANHSLSEGANFSKLLALQAKIVGKQRDIVQPGRLFIKEGELLKVCRKQIQPRWLVLLNDSLLYLKQIQSSDILYLKYELPLDDCQVSVAEDETREQAAQVPRAKSESNEREFNIRTTVRSMTLVARSQQERNEWLAALRSTIGEHVAKRRSFQQAGGNSSPQKGLAASLGLPDLVGRKAPIWTPDSRVATCELCTSNFSALFRRHHCRACGRVVCSACSGNRAPLIYLKCRAARVCDQCFDQLRDNMHLYYRFSNQIDEREMRRIDEHFKTLLKSQFVKHVISWSKSNKANKQPRQHTFHKANKQK